MEFQLNKFQANLNIFLSRSENFQQALKNVGSNILVYLVSLLINFWFTPYLLTHLGVEIYGLVPLATSVTNYLGLITLGLTAGVGRFLTLDLEKGERKSANTVFNTSFWGAIGITVIISLVSGFIVFYAPSFFHVPIGNENSTRWLFIFVIASFIITTIGSSFSASTYARNRIDLRNIYRLGDQFIRAFFAVFLFFIFKPEVWQVGLGILFATLFSFLGDVYLWKKLTPELSPSIHSFDFQMFKHLFSFGGWQVLNQIGALLFLNISLIVLNVFTSPEAAGQYGAIILFSTAIRSLAGSIFGGISPYLMKKYANGEVRIINKLSISMVKYFCLSLALPVGLLCGFATPMLLLWLGKDFANLSPVFVIIMFHLPINLSFVPLFDIQNAFGKVKWPGIVTLILGVIDLLLDIWFATLWGLVGVVIADAIVLLIKNPIFTSVYGAHIQKLPRWVFLKAVIPGLIGEACCFSISYFVTLHTSITNWFILLFWCALIGIVYISVMFYMVRKESQGIWG